MEAIGHVCQPGRSFKRVPTAGSIRTGADGLYFYKNSLIAIHPDNPGRTVARYFLNESLDRIERWESIESQHPALAGQPTTGVIVGDELYYIANSQLQIFARLFRRDQTYPMDQLKEVVILKVRL